jgi:hypothetical protein
MTVIYDIEVASNFFSATCYVRETDEWFTFECSYRKNEISQFIEFLKKVKFLVGFNSIEYDDIIIKHILNNEQSIGLFTNLEITESIFNLSKLIISNDYESYKQLKYQKTPFVQIDLIKFWSKLIVQSKHISLKAVAIFLKHENIIELPYDPELPLPEKEFDSVLHYNKNDVIITNKLYDKMKAKIVSRFTARTIYKNAISIDDVNLGLLMLKKKYCDKVGIRDFLKFKPDPSTKLHQLYGRDILPDFIHFNLPEFKKVHEKWLNTKCDGSFSESIVLPKYGIAITLGSGGAHTKNKSELVKPKDGFKYVTSDINSLYPNIDIFSKNYPNHLKPEFTTTKQDILKERISAKKVVKKYEKVEPVTKEEVFECTNAQRVDSENKLILNGTIGMYKSEYAWLYDPLCNLKICLIGQMFMLMITEACFKNGWQVDEINTKPKSLVL